MFDQVTHDYDHEMAMIFVEYELANSWLAPLIFWDGGQKTLARVFARRAVKKYKLYLQYLNTREQLKNES